MHICRYPFAKKGYQVYDLEINKFFSSRDVVFHEHIFPFHSNPQEVQNDEVVLPLPYISETSTPQADARPLSPPVPNLDTPILP